MERKPPLLISARTAVIGLLASASSAIVGVLSFLAATNGRLAGGLLAGFLSFPAAVMFFHRIVGAAWEEELRPAASDTARPPKRGK
jgi:RsiW-degrading membrane proteinase PrsW (M82 family)